MNLNTHKLTKHNIILSIIGLAFTFSSKNLFAENTIAIFPPPAPQKYDENFQVPFLFPNKTPEKIEPEVLQTKEPEKVTPIEESPAIKKINELGTKAFLEKKEYLKKTNDEPSLWQGASIVVGFISLIGFLALILAKISKKRRGHYKKTEKSMDLISTLSITPKRQIMLLQIRNKEFAITNTEHGIQLLAEINSSTIPREIALEKKPFQLDNFLKSIPNQENSSEKNHTNQDKDVQISEKKSDILMKALKRMDKEVDPGKVVKNTEVKTENIDGKSKFPKYFSNIFENEAKKDIKKIDDPDSVENVTNLIREKLRSMKPLN